jgi:peptidyl-dipeptidase Dcp
LLFTDYHPRESKRGGAWCGGFREHSISKEGTEIKPLISMLVILHVQVAKLLLY